MYKMLIFIQKIGVFCIIIHRFYTLEMTGQNSTIHFLYNIQILCIFNRMTLALYYDKAVKSCGQKKG